MKKYMVPILSVLVLFVACDDGLPGTNDTGDGTELMYTPDEESGLWGEAGTKYSIVNIASQVSGSRSLSRVVAGENLVYFRSSDIEFWSVQSLDDLEAIHSSKYNVGSGTPADYAAGQSLEYYLGDSVESVVFSPDSDKAKTLGAGLNPAWQERTANFIASGITEINFMRLDIGGGGVTFVIDGEERSDIVTVHGDSFWGIDANSILFVDKEYLKKPYLVTRSIEYQLIDGSISAEELGLDDELFSFIKTVHRQSNTTDSVTPIDVNGALYIPATPVDLSSFDPATQHLVLEISWPIADAVHEKDGVYFLDNRVGDTPFDFDLIVKIEDGAS